MVKLNLKKVGILKFGLFSLIYGAIMGLIAGIFVGLFSALMTPFMDTLGSASFGVSFGWFSVILFPLSFGIGGFIGGLIIVLIINLILKIINGMDVNLEEVEEKQEILQKDQPSDFVEPKQKIKIPKIEETKKIVSKPVQQKIPSAPKIVPNRIQ